MFIVVGGLFGPYSTSVLLRLEIRISSSEVVQSDQRVGGNSMVIMILCLFATCCEREPSHQCHPPQSCHAA
eukprot:369810-Heterocapsa_arctica.AAC.1